MPLFWKPYQSDDTQFIETHSAKKPAQKDDQEARRALLWDKPQNPENAAAFKAARVPQGAYVYFGKTPK